MSGKNAKLIRSFVKKANQHDLEKIGLTEDEIIFNPTKGATRIFKVAQKYEREKIKKLMLQILTQK